MFSINQFFLTYTIYETIYETIYDNNYKNYCYNLQIIKKQTH
jgi:hypothetical protein